MAGALPEQPIFYYDLSSPEAYLVAERSAAVLGEVPEWQPVRLAGLRAGEVGPFRCAAEIDAYQEDIGRRVAAYGLQPLRWPAEFPADTEWAMLVATYAKQIGRAVAFSLAAFRQAFAGGRDLSDPDTVMLAAAACEMHPVAVEKGARLASIAPPPRRRDGGGRGRRRARRAGRPRRRARVPRRPRARGGRGGRWRRHEGQPRVRAAACAAAAAGRRCSPTPDRTDHVEVVEIATGEVVLFWDTRPAQTRRLARGLRTDLAQLEADAFIAKWRRWQVA